MALAVLAAASGAAQAADSPFAGTWKMDVAKSHLVGDTVTYAKTATGFESSGGSITYKFAIDGKDYPMLAGRTAAWSQTTDGGWDVVYKANGKVMTKLHRAISADGKQMLSTYAEPRPDGSTVTEKDLYERVSGTSGLTGKWKNVKVDAVGDSMTIAVPTPGAFKIDNATYKQVVSRKTDGSSATVTGPTIPPGATATLKAAGPGKWDYAYLLKAKVFGQGVMAVSADGKTLTDTSWSPGKKAEKSVLVYARQ